MKRHGRAARLISSTLLLLCVAVSSAFAAERLVLGGSFPGGPHIYLTPPELQTVATPPDGDVLRPRGIRQFEGPVPPDQSNPASAEAIQLCPTDFEGHDLDGPPLSCTCTPEESTAGHSSVFGDGVYAGHSSLCLSARHAGVITGRGGVIVATPAPTPAEDPPFPSVLRNGIQSYGTAPVGASFRVSTPGGPATLPPVSSHADMRVMEFCPNNYQEYPLDGPPLTCGCTVEASTPGLASVFGDKVYAGHSSLCLAARHAGVITGRGGRIIVTPLPTPRQDPPYASVLRNGIQSYGTTPIGPSFRVASADSVVQAPIAETLRAQGRVQMYVNFDTDRATLQPSAEPILRELLDALSGNPELRVDLIGHTDAVGSAARNLDLSSRRATTVFTWLVQHGISPSRLRTTGRGFDEPIADNNTPGGRALNRRVEVRALN